MNVQPFPRFSFLSPFYFFFLYRQLPANILAALGHCGKVAASIRIIVLTGLS